MKKRSSLPPRSSLPRPAARPRREERRSDNGPRPPRMSLDLYGVHAVREAILNPARIVASVYATEDQAEMVDDWVQTARRAGIKRPDVMMPPRVAFDAACPLGAVHQGVGIECDPMPETDLDDVLRGLPVEAPGLIVLLDQVTDPHNFGAILRSSCAFGAVAVVVQKRHAPDLNALIAKTACGAVEHVPICYETNLSRSIEALKEAGFTVLGLDERGAVALPDVAPPARSVLVLGAEGPGLRRLIREGCDQLVRLPTRAPIASLNVSNAAAVALYHLQSRT